MPAPPRTVLRWESLTELMRRTKILATVGPATDRADRLLRLLESGTDAFRINVSHGSDQEHRATLRRLHEVCHRARREVALVVDVQGPKLRIGEIAGGAVRPESGRLRFSGRPTVPFLANTTRPAVSPVV